MSGRRSAPQVSSRDGAALRHYLTEIGRHPLLDAAGERQLAAELARARGHWARVVAGLPWVLEPLIEEISVRLARGERCGDLIDGLDAGESDRDAEMRALTRLVVLADAARANEAGQVAREWLLRQFAVIRWRAAALAPYSAPFERRVAEMRDDERLVRQLCRFGGGLAPARVDAVPPGRLDRDCVLGWAEAGVLAPAVAAGLLDQLEPVWRRQDGRVALLDMEVAQALALAERLETAVAEVARLAEALVCANLRLVVAVARGYQHRGVPVEDLVQEGNIGLLRAVERFDHRLGYRFSTYAVWWIRQAVARGVAEQGRSIRVPRQLLDLVNRLRAESTRFVARTGREPTVEELLALELAPPERVRRALELVAEPISLEAPLSDDRDETLHGCVADERLERPAAAAERDALQAAARGLLGALPARAALVLRLRYGIETGREHGLAEIGDMLALSGERVRQIERDALARLRQLGPDLRQLLEDL